MFYSHELLSLRHKGKLARCWLAATVSDQIFKQMCKPSAVNAINLNDLCNEIINIIQTKSNEANRRLSLYLSSQLMYGAIKIFLYQTTSLQNQIFQIDKKALCYRKNETYEINNSSIDFELCNVTSLATDNIQSNIGLPTLQDKFNINYKIEAMMHDATCLDFGALTHEPLNFLHSNDDDISLEMFDRMHNTKLDFDDELSGAPSNNEKILTDFEKSELSMRTNEIEISISSIHENTLQDQMHQVSFLKNKLPDETIEEMKSERYQLLTSQKRQSSEDKHVETPSKRRRLRFEDALDVDKVEIAPIPQTAIVSTAAINHPLEVSQNLELVENTALWIERKSQKKKVIADKNIKLSHKTIKKWLNNINAHTVPLNFPIANMPTTKVLLKAPSINFTSLYKKKCNDSLSALFHTHTVAVPKENTMPMEYGELLEKSTEFTRFEDRTNKTEEMFSELSSALGKFAELSKNVTSEKNITIAMDEFPQVSKAHDMVESIIDVPEVIQTPEITEEAIVPDTSQNTSKSLSSCLITKRELLVLLEIIWQNNDFATFNDIISSDHYSKLDASSCFAFLLELHKENTIRLKQVAAYDIIWIQKYA